MTNQPQPIQTALHRAVPALPVQPPTQKEWLHIHQIEVAKGTLEPSVAGKVVETVEGAAMTLGALGYMALTGGFIR